MLIRLSFAMLAYRLPSILAATKRCQRKEMSHGNQNHAPPCNNRDGAICIRPVHAHSICRERFLDSSGSVPASRRRTGYPSLLNWAERFIPSNAAAQLKSFLWMLFRLGWFPIQKQLVQELTIGSRIGFLSADSPDSEAPGIKQLPHELDDLRNVEGKTIFIENRFAGATSEPVPKFAAEMVSLTPDVTLTGNLISHGWLLAPNDRGAAVCVHKMLKGAKPANLPVEPLTNFAFVINRKTAKQIGTTIRQHVLAKADRVIR